jgi:hypothetical protein
MELEIIYLELFKNSAAVCFSDKIPTGKPKNVKESFICALYFIFLHLIFNKAQLFSEGHKNLRNLSHGLDIY